MLSKSFLTITGVVAAAVIAAFLSANRARADEPKPDQLARWEEQYQAVVKKGRALWIDAKLGENGVTCAQCHPNAANTHPETYPKFQQQLGRVAALRDMINWCLMNPLQGKPLAFDDAKMVALEAYVTNERRGVPLTPGKH